MAAHPTHLLFESDRIVIRYKELKLVLQQVSGFNTRVEHMSAANSPTGVETWLYSIEKNDVGLAVERRADRTSGILRIKAPFGALIVEDLPEGLLEEIQGYIAAAGLTS